jgi:hypothetical protein
MVVTSLTYPDLSQADILRNYIAYLVNVARFGKPFDHLGKALIVDDEFAEDDLEQVILQINLQEYIPLMILVYDYLAKKSGKKYWYAKSQVVFFEEIQRWVPKAKFIEIVRDPRDVLASKKKDKESVWGSEKYKPEKRYLKDLEKAYDPIWDSLSWKAEISTGINIEEKLPNKKLTIRYEDLVAYPEKYAISCCEFLGTVFYDNQLDVPRRNSSIWESRPKGIGTQSIEKWKKILTAEEIYICQKITCRQIRKLEYIHHKIKINWCTLIQLIFRSFSEFFVRLYKRSKMGDRKFFLYILNYYWKKLKKLV